MKNIIILTIIMLCVCSIGISQQSYWSTAHMANWDFGNMPLSKIPYPYLTHLIMFAGGTGGRQTNGSYPFYQVPSNFDDADHYGDTLRSYGKKYGVKILIDLGLNSSSGYDNVWKLGDTAIQRWAQTVGRLIATKGYDGGDFDWEGGGYPLTTAGHLHKMSYDMVKYVRDTLAALVPGKKFYFTCDLMANTGDVGGWDLKALTNDNLIDQVNIMWYDQCFPEVSPLYKSTTNTCWSSDSAVAFQFAAAGIPKNKIGLGYAIQVYTGCNSCYAYFSQQISHFSGATVYWDDQSKERWLTNGSYSLAYEDTLTGWWKADFIKRNGFGGAMGFSICYGYLPNPPTGWQQNPAVYGVGKNLLNNVAPPPVVLSVTVTQSPNVLIDSVGKTMTFTAVISTSIDSLVWFQNGSKIYKNTSPPFTYSWTPSSAGSFPIICVAYNSSLGSAQSNTITITVPTPPSPPVTIMCNYDSVAHLWYTNGQLSINKDSVYQAGIAWEKSQVPDSLNVTLIGKIKVPK